MQQLAQGIASLGRGEDTQLVHMTPGEVQGLQQLALSHGGSLTVNPHTGLVEAGFLSSLLSIGGGIVGSMFGPLGAAAGSSLGSLVAGDDPKTALMRGALSGGLSGLMGGVESVGGDALSEATRTAAQDAGKDFVTNEALKGIPEKLYAPEIELPVTNPDLGSSSAFRTPTFETADPMLKPYNPIDNSQYFSAPASVGETTRNLAYSGTPDITTPAMPSYTDKLGAGFNQVTSSGKNAMDFLKDNKLPLAAAGIGLAGMIPPPTPVAGLQDKTGYSPQYTYDPKTQRYIAAAPMSYTYKGAEGGEVPGFKDGVYIPQSKDIRTDIYGSNAGPIGPSGMQMFKNTDKYAAVKAQMDRMSPSMLAKLKEGSKDAIIQAAATTELYDRTNTPNASYIDQPTIQAAQGGIMGMADGGYTSSATAQDAPQYQYNPADQTYAQQAAAAPQGSGNMFIDMAPQLLRALTGQTSAPTAKQYSYDPKGQSYAQNMAAGGVASLPNEYAAGGKLLQGPGDGMSDSIPAVIKGDRPQRAALAQGEFVVPADVVSHLGNGSTDAGAKRLYAMMDKIRHARTGNKAQGKQINPANFMPA